MPIPKTYRVNPIDLQPNVAVGFSLPLNGPAVFYSTYTTKDQAKYNLINYLLTNKGERIENPNFGSDIKKFVFEAIVDNNIEAIKETIRTGVAANVPEIVLESVETKANPDFYSVEVIITYSMRLSGDKDTVTINFE